LTFPQQHIQKSSLYSI